MKIPVLVLACAFAGCALDPELESETAAVTVGFVHRSGATLVGNDGAPLHLRGVNLGGWLLEEGWIMGGIVTGSGNAEKAITARLTELYGAAATDQFREAYRDAYITEADIARIAALGFNSIRVPFNHDHLDLTRLDDVIAWAEAHHLYVILDLHAAPGGQCSSFTADPDPTLLWQSTSAQTQTIELWRTLAARYRDRRWVAGYDLLNEPCSVSNTQLAAFDRQLVTAIRSVDPNHAVIVEGDTFATDFTGFTAPIDPNMVYSFHLYTFFGDNRAAKLAEYSAMSAAQNVPLWAGEFGESSAAMLASTVAMFEDIDAGWALWTYKRAQTANPTIEEVLVPAAWNRVIDWVTQPGLHWKPNLLDALIGKAQFLTAIKLGKTVDHAAFAAQLLP